MRLDEQAFVLPVAFQSATLTDIIFNGSGGNPQGDPFLASATVGPAAVPEPSSWVLDLVSGTAAMAWGRFRGRRARKAPAAS